MTITSQAPMLHPGPKATHNDLTNDGSVYQVTFEQSDGDWVWFNTTGMSFQGACKEAVKGCIGTGVKLISIQKII